MNEDSTGPRPRPWWFPRLHLDLPGFVGALILLNQEFSGSEKPTLAYIGGALLGLPFVARGDIFRKARNGNGGNGGGHASPE